VPLDGSSNNNSNYNNLGSSFNSTTNANNNNNNNEEIKHGSDVIHNDHYDLKLEKSNILMLGPTGSGK
jgi:ATP-dependent Clp protease ATP-binding subunit ClpX